MARPVLAREDGRVRGLRRDVGGEKRSEPGALGRQSIQVGARVTAVAITREMVGPEGIGDDQQDPQILTPGARCGILAGSKGPGPSWPRPLPSHQKASKLI